MCKKICDIDMCVLAIMYPNSDASTYACDEECYYAYAGTEKDIALPIPPLKLKSMKAIKGIKRKR